MGGAKLAEGGAQTEKTPFSVFPQNAKLEQFGSKNDIDYHDFDYQTFTESKSQLV